MPALQRLARASGTGGDAFGLTPQAGIGADGGDAADGSEGGRAGTGGQGGNGDAAGRGWFVDPTPNSNEEFSLVEAGRAVAAGALERVDLLTAILHEFGHVLGLEHDHATSAADDLMFDELGLGLRRLPTSRLFMDW